ncbi:MAG: PEP-CTERM sorting domain-containing protein [Nitrospiraceae bacterium]
MKMRRNTMTKFRVILAVSAVAGSFVLPGFVWQAEAFFTRGQCYLPPTNYYCGSQTNPPTQIVVDQGGGGDTGGDGTGGIVPTTPQQPTVVNPEPSTVLLLASGLLGMGLWRRRQQQTIDTGDIDSGRHSRVQCNEAVRV